MERLGRNGQRASTSQNDIRVDPDLIETYKLYSSAGDKKTLLDQITQKIPMVGEIRSGGNMKERFYKMCGEKGVNPDDILAQFKR